MNKRTLHLKQIRPDYSMSTINNNMSSDERFQNLVLRPIIEFQENLFVVVFKNYIIKHKNVFCELSIEKRIFYIENAIQKDMKFRNSLKGMVIGLFTVEEYLMYIENSSSLNKRMMQLVKEQLLDNIQLLETSKILTAV